MEGKDIATILVYLSRGNNQYKLSGCF